MIPVPTTGARRTLVIAFSTALAAALAVGACGPDEPEFRGPIDAETYVTVMGELADLDRFPPSGPGEAARAERADSARQVILERNGVTPDELLEFAEAAGAHPDLMVELSERIVALSDSLATQRTDADDAADSAAERDLGLEPRRPAADSLSAPATAAERATATEATDSTPAAAGLESRPLRERARELRERADAEREPAP